MKKNIKISIIIPTHNRASYLKRCLVSITKQSINESSYEVLVVNNGCSDNTDEVCALLSNSFKLFTVIHEPQIGLLAARHAGLHKASADILVFCDDDIEANPLWLSTIAATFAEHSDVALVGGNNLGMLEADEPEWFADLWTDTNENLRHNFYFSLLEGITNPILNGNPYLVFGCNFSVRRAALMAAGGFEPDVMGSMLLQGGGESSVSRWVHHNKLKTCLHPGASVRHYMPASRLCLEYMHKRGIYTGICHLYTHLRHHKHQTFTYFEDRQHPNPALRVFYEAACSAQQEFASLYDSNKYLREWVHRSTYLGKEAPPVELHTITSELSSKHGW